MKYILSFLFITMLTVTGFSQEGKFGDYALLVRKVDHIKAGLKTAAQLKSGELSYKQMEIIVCGKEVKELSENSELKDFVAEAKSLNVRISFCGMSLNKFSVDPSRLPKGVEVVPNGLIRLFELQQKGYQTLEL